ncbi:unnamed protein product [Rotaria sp. Silwood2]|nr:unnamed protein product [Rotaria sp. Silwood2]CAF2898417.1 unnamed protein product [Rotaria sp. Silwood2]CAF4070792.1 unnamed protein product [Rotaria sp. Silwood2]CAF4078980.1 unnamed protein product [Rotaria sp. Silwood2]
MSCNLIVNDQLLALARKYEIRRDYAERLRILKDFEIVLLCDDSGSMKTPVDDGRQTRWEELCASAKIVLEVGTIFDENGVDLCFLNRRSFYRIKEPREVEQAFSVSPSGYTPLVTALRSVLQMPASRRGYDKKLLIFIVTDGEPTDEEGNPNRADLEHIMRNERNSDTTHVMFLLCTDEPACVDYLRQWDQTMKNVDVTDDFRTQKAKIRQYLGANYSFSFGDYIVKALIGAVDPEIDGLDEPPPVNNN